ncbi:MULTISPECIES: DNA helicase RecQ [Rufibacter]|uniref:DNA helicase RecQ n=1 Tax=Rufibacter quisquiliarum TaxID=1549639 RepID=A0A839GT05_9BACT|nr:MULTISPECIES: DNA helicase RecQ [Rufibacter]MBA9076931.1 ATP-dependent DNA helicase RecQ [Rufibacter quisquiliarum]
MLVKQESLKDKLKEVFGYSQFRGNQEAIIENIMAGKNTFVIMPTGAGKSLCYQLPALAMEGTAIVISPLIALMKNQVDQLNAFGVNAQFLNSTLSKAEMNKVKRETVSGEVRLLYVAPESLTKEETLDFLKQAKISFVAIDEAHCISEWGHDFRPEYRKIRGIIDNIGDLPIIALTATATPKVQLDIQKNLQMDDASVFKSSFNRTNLYYEVRPKHNTKKQVIQYIKKNKGKSGIIYCLSRKKVEEIAELLKVNDIKALPYHAGLDSHVRMANQDAFLNEDADVIVATIAFGMGIDKPDVRFVIHYDTPKSIEGYYQETGRAGRDGLEGNCLMFYSYDDIVKLEKFSKDKPVTERDNSKLLLQEMASYADSAVCRRRQLLHYFGETYDKDCGFCDNCVHPKEKFEAQEELVLALKAVVQTNQRFGMDHLVHVLTGMKDQYVDSYSHDQLEVFGAGKEQDAAFWNSIIRQALLFNFLEKDIENFGTLKISEKGENFIQSPHPIKFAKDHNFDEEVQQEEEKEETQASAGHDAVLFDMLKALRKKLAKDMNLPPYVLFQDPSLKEMATTYPTTREDLAHIAGVGMGKVQKFGKPFLELIAKYVEENDIVTAADVVVKTTVNKSKLKIYVIQQIDKKMDLEEIASSKGITMPELIEEIEHICYSGTKLNLDYYINNVLDQDRQQEVIDYFMSATSDNMALAIKELGTDDYTEEDLRLMRIKFLSKYAN